MTLQNVLRIHSLIASQAQRDDIQLLLTAAECNLRDASVTAISDETSTSKPGHHQTAIQTLPLTVRIGAKTVIVLDGIRKQRNITDYDGDPISPRIVEECIERAHGLLVHVCG